MVTRWRFLLPVVMVLMFTATLAYPVIKTWVKPPSHDGWDIVSCWDCDPIEDGLVAFQAVGLIPAAILLADPVPSFGRWWIFLADAASISSVWFVIGLAIDLLKKRSKLEPLRLR